MWKKHNEPIGEMKEQKKKAERKGKTRKEDKTNINNENKNKRSLKWRDFFRTPSDKAYKKRVAKQRPLYFISDIQGPRISLGIRQVAESSR